MKHGQTAAKILNGAIIICMAVIIALFAATPFLSKYMAQVYVAQSFIFFYTAGALAPVSYTHLDVYKRQERYPAQNGYPPFGYAAYVHQISRGPRAVQGPYGKDRPENDALDHRNLA